MSMLLSPIEVGSIEIRNRVAFTAHGSFLDFYRPGISGDRYTAYEERRAAGGAGVIFLQTVHVHPSSHSLGHAIYDPDDLRTKLTGMADRDSTGTARRSFSSSITSAPSSARTRARTSSRSGPSTTSSRATGRPPTG